MKLKPLKDWRDLNLKIGDYVYVEKHVDGTKTSWGGGFVFRIFMMPNDGTFRVEQLRDTKNGKEWVEALYSLNVNLSPAYKKYRKLTEKEALAWEL